MNKGGEHWETFENNCNDCFTQCFREPSIETPFEDAKLVSKIWWFNHVKKPRSMRVPMPLGAT
jgi:hypothetical protein